MMTITTLIRSVPLALICVALVSSARAASSSSTNYSIVADSLDGGGAMTSATNYTCEGSAGGIGGLSTVASPSETVKAGYIGQLYQVTGVELDATFADNGATQQLMAAETLDDGTNLSLATGDPSQSWSITAGQLPTGLTLNMSTGVISGTPTGSGPYSFTVQVIDGLGDTAQQAFSGTGSTTATDTPTMPVWGLIVLAILLYAAAGGVLGEKGDRDLFLRGERL